jgi:hypothetical protein
MAEDRIVKKREEADFYERKAKSLRRFAIDLLDNCSLHFMEPERLKKEQDKIAASAKNLPKSKPKPAPAETEVRAIPQEDLAKIVEECEQILLNMDDWITASEMALKLLHAGLKHDLEPMDFARAVREAMAVLGGRLGLEVKNQAGVGRRYRIRGVGQ